jgi:hypothetical protein
MYDTIGNIVDFICTKTYRFCCFLRSIAPWNYRFGKPKLQILPKGVRYVQIPHNLDGHFHKGCIIVEQKPQKRTLLYLSKVGDTGKQFLSFPHAIFVIQFMEIYDKGKLRYRFRNVQVGFSNIPVASPHIVLKSLPLSNYEGQSVMGVCLGDAKPHPNHLFDSLSELANYIISAYWQSSFSGMNQKILENWQKKTEKNQSLSKLMVSHGTIYEVVPGIPIDAEFYEI